MLAVCIPDSNAGDKAGDSGISLSISMGKQQQSQTQTTAAASTVGSTAGNVTINDGQTYTQTGSNVLTPGLNSPFGSGNIDITAKSVTINEARETGSQSSEQKFQQSGITLAVTSPVISTLQGVQQQAQAAGNTQSSRMQALAAANAAMQVKQGASQVQDAVAKGDATGGAGISVSLGSSSSQSKQQSSADNARGSSLTAGGNIQIQATGAGANSNITVQGSDIKAVGTTALKADNQVSLLAAQNTTQETSANKSSSASIGLTISTQGVGVTASASKATGQGAGNGTTYTNTHVEGGQQVVIQSGADTTLKGATVTGNQVSANVGGNLNIQSLQDTATSNANQSNTGVALSIPVLGAGGSASLSMAKQRSNSNYQSVGEQSGIQAGADGFQINVQGNTDLKGAVISSNADASKNTLTTNTLTTSDINNSMSASASSSGTSVGNNMLAGKYELSKALAGNVLNNGSANQSDASTTTSVISAAQVTVGNKTTDTSKEQLTDSNGKTVSTDASNTNRTLAKADVAGLQKSAQEQQASNMLVFKAAVAIADDGLKKMAKPQLRQVFCLAEPCSNDQVANTAKIGSIAQKLMSDNPDMSKDQATTLAIAAVVGKDGDPAKADPQYSESNPNRFIKPIGQDTEVKNIQTVPTTVESLQNLPNDQKFNSTVFANGIFNSEQRAAELAVQQTPKLDPNDPEQRQKIQSTGTVLQGDTYLVSTDKSNNSLGEYVTAGVEKLAEILGIPTPAAELKAQVIKTLSTNNATGQTDNQVNSIGHSRGTMTDVNAYNVLGAQGFYNPNLKVIENNPAATQERIEQSAGKVTDPANVQIYAPRNDPVSTFVGGYGQGNNLEALKEVPAMATTSNSVHSSPGSGAVGSNSADVNQPFSYQGLDIDQLNQARQPQTNAILEQIQANPKPVPIAQSTDQATKLQEQMGKDSNAQMNQLLSAPITPLAPSLAGPQAPSSRLDQLNQFKQGN